MIENDSRSRLAQRRIPAVRAAPDDGAPPDAALSRLRLLTVLDALLATRSVTGAAEALGLPPTAVSRMLAQLRVMYGDELMVRAGRGLAPTALAEALGPRLRALVVEAEQLMAGVVPAPGALPPAPPGLGRDPPPDGQPDALHTLARRGPLDPAAPGTRRLARHVATAGQARALDRAEAEDAFSILFDGEAHEVQVGALLMAMQMRGITAPELAGMVAAARRGLAPLGGAGGADLDWPAHLSPRNRRPPWFLLAARLVADAGYRVALHGQQAELLPYAALLAPLGIPVAGSVAEAGRWLAQEACVFLPLPAVHPRIAALMRLYRLFDMRSPLSLGRQLLNPLAAPVTLMGLPDAARTTLHREAAALLGLPRLVTLDSHRDVAQAAPHRLMRIAAGGAELAVPPSAGPRPEAAPADPGSLDDALGLWAGTVCNPGGTATVVDTAAAALIALGAAPPDMAEARAQAAALWQSRQRRGGRA